MIPVNEPLLDGNEKKYLIECVETGWISSEGSFVKRFEEEFSTRMRRKFGIAVCNGTAALDVAVAALGIGHGDEVIMPAFTIISCAAAVIKAGATPVLVDSDPFTWNMDVGQVEEKITSHTKAIMAVHIYGLPVDMDPLLDLARANNLFVIEDSAEAIGLEYKGRPCGSFGDISIFSFYPNKHVTTGEGGMVVTDDEKLAEGCRSFRNLCFQKEKRFYHDQMGWNYRMTNLQAAIGVAQLEKLEHHINRKREMGSIYTRLLEEVTGIQLPIPETDYAKNIYWVYGVVLKESTSLSVEKVMEILSSKGIGTRPFFWPMHEQPVFNRCGLFTNEKYPIAERLARQGFYLPSGMTLSEQQIETVCEILTVIMSGE